MNLLAEFAFVPQKRSRCFNLLILRFQTRFEGPSICCDEEGKVCLAL